MTIDSIKAIVYLLGNAFNVYIIKIFLDNFLVKSRISNKSLVLAYLGYYIINSGIFLMLNMLPVVTVTMSTTAILTFCLSFCYAASLRKRLIYSIFSLLLGAAAEILFGYLAAIFFKMDYVLSAMQPMSFIVFSTMSRIFFYVIVKIICKCFSKVDDFEIPISYWLAIFIAPAGNFYVVWVILQQSKDVKFNEISTVAITWILISTFLMFFLYERIISFSKMKTQNTMLSLQNTYYAKQYQIMEEANAETRQLRHDLRGHLAAIKTYSDNGDITEVNGYIENLLGKTAYTGRFSNCGIIAIDGMINLKMHEAVKLGAKIDVEVNVPGDIQIDPVDMTVILSNLLDNAVDACGYVDLDKRFINTHMEYDKGNIFINIINSCDDSLTEKSVRGSQTTKRSKAGEIHGQGLDNVRNVVKKYDGTVCIDTEPQKFICSILMYSVERKIKTTA